jgi:hypothetical protein
MWPVLVVRARATLDAFYRHGTITLPRDLQAPRISAVTSRDLASNIDLVPTKRQPESLEPNAA